MKKILRLSLILVMMLFIAGCSSYAAMECTLGLSASKSTDLELNDEITVNINISNIVSKNGMVTLGAKIEYPSASLELLGIDGEGIGFNKAKNKLLVTRTNPIQNSGTVATLKFKVKSIATKNLMVRIYDITLGDGSVSPTKKDPVSVTLKIKEDKITLNSIRVSNEPSKKVYTEGENFDKSGMKVVAKYSNGTEKEVSNYTITDGNNLAKGKTNVTISYAEGGITKTVAQAITVNEKKQDKPGENKPGETEKPGESEKPGETEKPGNTTEPDNTVEDNTVVDNTTVPDDTTKPSEGNNGADSTIKDEKLPQTGFNHKIIPCIIIAIVILAWALYIKIKLIDRRIKRNEEE